MRMGGVVRVAVSLGICLAACGVELELPEDALVFCDGDRECPDGYVCARGVGRCVVDVTDNVGPQLLGAVAPDAVTVRLSFDERVGERGAEDIESYTFVPELEVVRAAVDERGQTVELTVESMRAGDTYTVSVSGVVDWYGNAIADGASAELVGFGTPPDRTAPEALAPEQDAVVRLGGVLFAWTLRAGAESYDLEVALDADFTQPIEGSPFTTSGTTLAVPVQAGAYTYYWRVRADVTDGDVPVQRFDGIDGVVRVYCAAGDDCADSPSVLEAGNLSRPYRSVARAVAAAVTQSAQEVRVAARPGGAAYIDAVTVPSGVRLSGGWGEDFSTVNPIDDTVVASAAGSVITVGLTTALTQVTGLTVRTEGSEPALQVVGSNGLLTVEDSTFTASPSATSLVVVRFNSAEYAAFTRNVVSGGPCPIGVQLNGSFAQLTDNDIDVQASVGGDHPRAVIVQYGGGATLTNNRITATSTAQSATAVDISFSGHAWVYDNTLVAVAPGSVYGLFIGHSGSAGIARNRVFALGTGGAAEVYALSTWEPVGTNVTSNVLYAWGGPYPIAANLLLSDSYVSLVNNTLLTSAGGTVVYLNYSRPVLANNIIAASGSPVGVKGVEEGNDARPAGFLNNLVFNLEWPYRVQGADTDPATLDDPSGAQPGLARYARFAGNIVLSSGALPLGDVLVDVDGPDNDPSTWADNDLRLLLATDPYAVAASGLDASNVEALPDCYNYDVVAKCPWVDRDVLGAARTPPVSIGAYEKD